MNWKLASLLSGEKQKDLYIRGYKLLDMERILYTPSDADFARMKPGFSYLQIWCGLPNLQFEDAESRRGLPSLVHREGSNYVWVDSEATAAVKHNPNAILQAHIRKRDEGVLEAWCVSIPTYLGGSADRIGDGDFTIQPHTLKLEDAIHNAKKFNRQKLQDAQDSMRKW
jgi:hypothetical protein